jgi:hypothetical protein
MARLFWTQRQDLGPSARGNVALAYDPLRQRTVLYGGQVKALDGGDPASMADTWEWDGQYWSQVSDIGPASTGNYEMAWDENSQRIMMFGGGQFGGNLPSDHNTWEWDGENWTQVDDGGPSARIFFGFASDTWRKRIVLFGGASVAEGQALTALGDTWEWDGEGWTQQEETGPSARSGQAMAFDPLRKRIVLFGGAAINGLAHGDTWEWDGTLWTQVSDVGPAGRVGTALAFNGQHTILFGGQTMLPLNYFGDTWSWDGKHWTQRQDIGPARRGAHRLAYDSARERIVLFGGQTQVEAVGDTWELAERAVQVGRA